MGLDIIVRILSSYFFLSGVVLGGLRYYFLLRYLIPPHTVPFCPSLFKNISRECNTNSKIIQTINVSGTRKLRELVTCINTLTS